MLSSVRRLSKSTVGSIVTALFLLLIVASFAIGDVANLGGGSSGLSSSTLAKVGGQSITDRDLSRALERRLAQVRQENPEADYAALAADFEPLLARMIDERTLTAFADKHGFEISKRLVDAEIANIPGTRGLDGKFSNDAYQRFLAQQRLTDEEVRLLIRAGLMQRMLLAPVASNAKVPVGLAGPFASMLLEARQGEVALIPTAAFRAGLKPTDADIQRYYAANGRRYMVPEQRVLRIARIGPEQVAGVTATDQEIAAFYNANQATYGAKDIRVITQAVVPDQATANAIASRARSGGTFVAAAAPAGLSAADVSVGPQTRAEFSALAGDKVAAAAFAAQAGAIVGPIQSDLGWHVLKIDAVRREGGKTLAAARSEIAERLTAEKRREAITELVTRIEDAVSEGSNFQEAAALGKLPVSQTPLITASGSALGDPGFKLPPELAPALRSGFELQPNDEPTVETLPNEAGYLLVAPAQVVPSAPAPLNQIRARVAEDWITAQASQRAKAVADAIAAKVARGVALPQAVREAGTALPPVQPLSARRIDLSQLGPNVPPALRMLFNLSQGRSRLVADPQGRGYSVVKVNKVVPGNALTQPALISRVQNELQEPLSEEYARQFLGAIRRAVGVRRNEAAIAATKKRIVGS
jgi:peptidyl-prolyl cis-trans isomerase D